MRVAVGAALQDKGQVILPIDLTVHFTTAHSLETAHFRWHVGTRLAARSPVPFDCVATMNLHDAACQPSLYRQLTLGER
jgi:hypothetical protein